MSENTEAMNMLEDLPESAQDGQQEDRRSSSDDLAGGSGRDGAGSHGKRKQRLRFPSTVMRWER